METGTIFCYDFCVDTDEDDVTKIRIYGLNSSNESVCLKVNNFTPFCYIELTPPLRVTPGWKWSTQSSLSLQKQLEKKLGQFQPLSCTYCAKKKLYSNPHKKFPFLFCRFAQKRGIYILRKILTNIIKVHNVEFRLKIHEEAADEILQLTSVRKIPTAGWIGYTGRKVDTKETRAQHEFTVGYKTLYALQEKQNVPQPLVLSFDIEVYSSDLGRMPSAKVWEDKVFQISCVWSRGRDSKEGILLTLGNARAEDVGYPVKCCKSESILLETFFELIKNRGPQVIIGYNILGFDLEYLIQRAILKSCINDMLGCGYHRFRHAQHAVGKWQSAAYGNQEFEYLNWEGILLIDMLAIIRKDYKLHNYKLSTVGRHFLQSDKDPLDHYGIFKCYKIGCLSNARDEVKTEAMGVVGKYCMKDSLLVSDLFYELDTWIGGIEMAETCCVPMFYLVVRGQQIKVFSQVYRHCLHEQIVVESNGYEAKENERYVGAYVFDPVPGVYDNIVPFDFASLYPTTIIAYNIDFSTLVRDHHVPDSMCHVMEWEDHIGCPHDPKIQRIQTLTTGITALEKQVKSLRGLSKKQLVRNFMKEAGCDRKKAGRLRDQARVKIRRQIDKIRSQIKPYREERASITRPNRIICASHRYRFLKEPKGVIPTIIEKLLDARAATRQEGKKLKKENNDTTLKYRKVLDKRQLAYKVSANSMYGAMGVRRGFLPFMPGAMCTTAMGRKNNKLAAKTIVEKWKGKLVYGDTDSEYLFFPHITGENREEHAKKLWKYCETVAEDVTKMYPKPMRLEFEETIYHRFAILSKKRYMYQEIGEDGRVVKKVGNKGVCLTRRDNSNFVRKIYEGLVDKIFHKVPQGDILGWLTTQCCALFRRGVPLEDMIISKAVGSVGHLPLPNSEVAYGWTVRHHATRLSQKEREAFFVEKGHVKFGNYKIKILPQNPQERQRLLKLKHSTTPLEYYINSLPAHVALAVKMRSRGVTVSVGSRIEYVVIENCTSKKLIDKIEDVQYFKRHRTILKIDKMYYLKQLINPVDQLIMAWEPKLKNFTKNLTKQFLLRNNISNQINPPPMVNFIN